MSHPFRKFDKKVEGEDKDLYIEKSREIAKASQQLESLKENVHDVDEEKLKELQEAEHDAMVDLLKYEKWIEIDLGYSIKNILESRFGSLLKTAYDQLIKGDPNLMMYFKKFEKASAKKKNASSPVAILQTLLIKCFDKEDTLKKLDLEGLGSRYSALSSPVDGIVGWRWLAAMMEVAFGKVDGYESFDGADFTDEIFMTKYLHKVLSICGFDFDGVALTIDGEEKSRNELKDDLSLVEPTVEEEEPRELLSTEKISALSKKAITLPFVNMGTVSPIAAPLTNKEAKKQEKLASRQEKEQEKRAQKLNKLHRPSWGLLDAFTSADFVNGESMVDVWNNERADYNAKVFLQLCEESGNDFSQFDTEMFVRRFYQIFRPFGRLEAGKSISVLQKERTLFRLRVLRTILTKNQSFADFAKTIDLTDFQEAFSGGVKQADAMKKDFLQHVEQGHFTSSTWVTLATLGTIEDRLRGKTRES